MLDLSPDEEQRAVTELAHRIGLDVLLPAAREAEVGRAVPDKVWRTVFETGLTMATPERFGGGGVPDATTQMLAFEGLAYGDAGIAMAAVWHAAVPLLIGLCGTEEQASTLLPALGTDPDRRSAVALYEGFGRAPHEMTTTVSAGTDGSWRVRGEKVAVTAGALADPLVVVGVDPGTGRLRAAIVDGSRGVAFGPSPTHLALDAAPVMTASFDLTVPATAILGGVDADPDVLERAVGRLRLAVAAAEVGTAQHAIDYAANYAGSRVAFGKPIAAFQGVAFLLAEALIRVGAARLEIADIAARLGQPRTVPGHGAKDPTPGRGSVLEQAVTRAVNYAGAVATQSTRDALQVLGGHGFITDHPVERWYRAAAALSALDFDPLCSSFEPVL